MYIAQQTYFKFYSVQCQSHTHLTKVFKCDKIVLFIIGMYSYQINAVATILLAINKILF